jgi:serine/threonine protein kinase/WD40 repeat protein
MNEEEAKPLSEDLAANLLEAAFFGTSAEEDMDQASVDLSTDLPLIEGYKLIRLLGEGGFGMVYEAEQRMPIRRRVALKVLRPGCTTRELLVRFEQERQALALMNHPHVARIYDAGETEDGRPFIAMEMVDGQTIDRRARSLPLRDRIALMLDVSRAVAHAHHKGIIHRDLKPSNILVTDHDGKPEPRVIDFGIAKALDGPLVTKVMFTQIRQVVGTPGYMSPERQHTSQISHSADTRTDVFALGAILWELLSGHTPLQSADGTSTRVTLPNANEIPNELRWITEKATDPDMELRYANADGLADDLEAWLEGLPLKAAPRSTLYVISKWAARHRAAAVASILMLATLVASLLLLTRKNLEIRSALLQAEHSHTETQRRSSNESYLMGVTRERRRPSLALAHWAHALRQDPNNQAALGMALATLRHRGHARVIAPAVSLPEGKVNLLALSTGAEWFAAVVGNDTEQVMLRGRRGGVVENAIPIPADGAMTQLAVSRQGHVAVAATRGPVGLLQPDGTWKASSLDFSQLRYLSWTRNEELWTVTENEVSRCKANGTESFAPYPLPSRATQTTSSADGTRVATGMDVGRILLFEHASAEPTLITGPVLAPLSALALDATGGRVAAAWRSGDVWLWHGDSSTSAYLAKDAVLQLKFLQRTGSLLMLLPTAVACWDSSRSGPALRHPIPEPLKFLMSAGEAAGFMQPSFRRPATLDFTHDPPFAEEISGMEGHTTCASDPMTGITVVALEDQGKLEWLQYQAASKSPTKKLSQAPWLALTPKANADVTCGVSGSGIVYDIDSDGKTVSRWDTGVRQMRLAAVDATGSAVLGNVDPMPGVQLLRIDGKNRNLSWGKPSALALSRSGDLAALGFPSGEVRVFEVASEREVQVHDWQRGAVTSLHFISEDRIAVAVSGQVRVWDWRVNAALPTPIELSRSIIGMAACSEGKRLAVLGNDKALHVIHVASGRRVLGQTSADATANALVWSLQDQELWCVARDGSAEAHQMPPHLERCPEWFPSWLEQHVGLRIDDQGSAARIQSDQFNTPPSSIPRKLQAWLPTR